MRAPLRFIPTCVGQIFFEFLQHFVHFGSSPRAWGRCLSLEAGGSKLTVHPHVRGADCLPISPSSTTTAVHPHVRGADAPVCRLNGGGWLVHPHVRGADVYHIRQCIKAGRFIPTCVGQIPFRFLCRRYGIRFIPTCVGQMHFFPPCRYGRVGSSPRAWGRFRLQPGDGFLRRFIPTCMGQMRSRIFHRLPVTVHPHVRGADSMSAASNSGFIAVHPHVRGADYLRRLPQNRRRTVHPHVRGADHVAHVSQAVPCGSSPRAWGRCIRARYGKFRIVGSSPRAWGRFLPQILESPPHSVHPHVRGADKGGLGKLAAYLRFIPTCVGQMVPLVFLRFRGRFIPTCVGQMKDDRIGKILQCGSSPRAWGRLAHI